jgi:site-specific recombinase XerD
LNEANINIKAMQALLGHSDIETTMQIYVDASSQIMSRATQSYEDMINNMFPERNPN